MSFDLAVTTTTQTSGGTKKDVDWDALNEHVVEAAGTAKKARSIPGVISGIIDLGEQERPDYEEEFHGDEAARQKVVAEDPVTYFKEEGGKVYKCRPQKPVQQIAVTVDFPSILVDKGQFFGNSQKLPLRLLLNGEFMLNGERIVGKGYSITERKYDDGTWAFAKNNMIHRLAEACELLDDDGYFSKDNIGQLLGKVAQFQFRVYMKPSKKDKTKKYFTEEIKLVGVVPEGIPVPDVPEDVLYGVNMTRQNDEDAIKQLRVSVRNTIKKALNYEGSVLQQELDKHFNYSADSKPENKPEQAPVKQESTSAPADDNFDDDIPF